MVFILEASLAVVRPTEKVTFIHGTSGLVILERFLRRESLRTARAGVDWELVLDLMSAQARLVPKLLCTVAYLTVEVLGLALITMVTSEVEGQQI